MTGEQDTGNPAWLSLMATYLPLEEKARLGCLPTALHVEQIATLEYPGNRELAYGYARILLDACKNDEIPHIKGQQYEDWWLGEEDIREEFKWWNKKLELYEDGPTPVINRADYHEWLTRQGRPPPAWWFPASLLGTALAPATPTFPQGKPDQSKSGAAATRQIALVDAEDAALASLRNELKREPDFEEFWFYLTQNDDTGILSDHTDDRLIWTGKNGRNCETAKSTMRNRLTMAKRRNPFKV